MRSAADFNGFYAVSDPWRISHAKFRDKVLRRCVSKYLIGSSVLELGCGEGHLTQSIFNSARLVKGIDISDVAIDRARARNIPNASFQVSDFMKASFVGFDVIAAIECLYYLTPEDQEAFFSKLANEHRGIFILSGPIIGENEHRKYFTHNDLIKTFEVHRLSVIEFSNLNIYRRRIASILVRFPFCNWLLDYLPDNWIFQRCYILRTK
jgi:SAM-dependent methyltransferase